MLKLSYINRQQMSIVTRRSAVEIRSVNQLLRLYIFARRLARRDFVQDRLESLKLSREIEEGIGPPRAQRP